jgi:hypothetical protein
VEVVEEKTDEVFDLVGLYVSYCHFHVNYDDTNLQAVVCEHGYFLEPLAVPDVINENHRHRYRLLK